MADHSQQKLSFFEKAAYSGGDAAANFVFMTMVLFQLNFYTDTCGLSATAAAAILLWPRLWDAIADPIVGILADRTNTRWGKFRPWILFTAVPPSPRHGRRSHAVQHTRDARRADQDPERFS